MILGLESAFSQIKKEKVRIRTECSLEKLGPDNT
jgi:hypothetical protein